VFDANKFQERAEDGGISKGAMLGSASAAVGDMTGQAQNGESCKLQTVSKKKKKDKDKANVKYDFNDFLKQSQNITEQCRTYVESLSTGTQECTICANIIYQRSAIWNCK
jgi:hypothetical protein